MLLSVPLFFKLHMSKPGPREVSDILPKGTQLGSSVFHFHFPSPASTASQGSDDPRPLAAPGKPLKVHTSSQITQRPSPTKGLPGAPDRHCHRHLARVQGPLVTVFFFLLVVQDAKYCFGRSLSSEPGFGLPFTHSGRLLGMGVEKEKSRSCWNISFVL